MITFNNVSKKYMTKTALKDINIELNKGKIIGLVGENGSGKSTTLKLIAGLIQPSKGSVIVNGKKADRRIAKDVTYLSELDEYYSFYNVGQTIEFYASQFPDFNLVKAEEIREFMKLDKNTKLKHLSKGNRGRLKLILTLSRDVPVILLDEPFSGLDPMVRDSIVQGLISFVDLEKQIILITTHEIKEVEMILDEVIAIKDGQFIGHHNVEDLRYTQNMSIVEWMKTLYNE
ncbi:spermidine/putrescine ABC transporter ATP-binding protein [Alkalihalophilus pseudofirmus]|uniref:ABC transporter ATP-binding protein n=1 Tax=Alkalihalophilus TaxID=2893060 RepID=UPI00095233C3|nr:MULTISPECIES: ABC transporter ATP-binding protein [Alkalihalophilus]MED1601401.1 ABC transporter ATP-binding protein [Alkalihalophilus marmarensis]OLS36066.1 spermidine/putrescine ABC transporter ATP-binding protein [Alkalihalophilus pseudofirmus]WEG18234.1 ABC transporter ATP-binding protein [Alkalihalophilus pseudofirmus]